MEKRRKKIASETESTGSPFIFIFFLLHRFNLRKFQDEESADSSVAAEMEKPGKGKAKKSRGSGNLKRATRFLSSTGIFPSSS